MKFLQKQSANGGGGRFVYQEAVPESVNLDLRAEAYPKAHLEELAATSAFSAELDSLRASPETIDKGQVITILEHYRDNGIVLNNKRVLSTNAEVNVEKFNSAPLVIAVQAAFRLLKDNNQYAFDAGKVDGFMGSNTQRAILEFQRANPDLSNDGILGPATIGKFIAKLNTGAGSTAATGYILDGTSLPVEEGETF